VQEVWARIQTDPAHKDVAQAAGSGEAGLRYILILLESTAQHLYCMEVN